MQSILCELVNPPRTSLVYTEIYDEPVLMDGEMLFGRYLPWLTATDFLACSGGVFRGLVSPIHPDDLDLAKQTATDAGKPQHVYVVNDINHALYLGLPIHQYWFITVWQPMDTYILNEEQNLEGMFYFNNAGNLCGYGINNFLPTTTRLNIKVEL